MHIKAEHQTLLNVHASKYILTRSRVFSECQEGSVKHKVKPDVVNLGRTNGTRQEFIAPELCQIFQVRSALEDLYLHNFDLLRLSLPGSAGFVQIKA